MATRRPQSSLGRLEPHARDCVAAIGIEAIRKRDSPALGRKLREGLGLRSSPCGVVRKGILGATHRQHEMVQCPFRVLRGIDLRPHQDRMARGKLASYPRQVGIQAVSSPSRGLQPHIADCHRDFAFIEIGMFGLARTVDGLLRGISAVVRQRHLDRRFAAPAALRPPLFLARVGNCQGNRLGAGFRTGGLLGTDRAAGRGEQQREGQEESFHGVLPFLQNRDGTLALSDLCCSALRFDHITLTKMFPPEGQEP